MLIATILVVVVIRGLKTGEATFVYTSYKKSEDPIYYRAGIALPSILIVIGIHAFCLDDTQQESAFGPERT